MMKCHELQKCYQRITVMNNGKFIKYLLLSIVTLRLQIFFYLGKIAFEAIFFWYHVWFYYNFVENKIGLTFITM